MGNSATVGLPPLPEGATLDTSPAGSSGLPPLPEGATLNTPASAPDMQLHGLGGWLQQHFSNPAAPADRPAWETARGLIGSAAQPVATLLDLAGRFRPDPAAIAVYKQQHPEVTDDEQAKQAMMQEDLNTTTGKWGKHLADAAKWLRTDVDVSTPWEKVGAIGEQLLELLGPAELLKLGRGTEAVRAGTEAAEVGDRATRAVESLKNTQQTIATLKNNKIIAGLTGIGLKAVQDASVMGAQSYAHTEDTGEAAKAAALGGVFGAGAGSLEAGGRYLMNISPVDVTRLGESFPVMRQQLNAKGAIEQGNVTNIAPALAEKQQAALPGMMRNVARRATANALGIVNQSRMAISPVEDASRLLAAPEGAQDFIFSLETPGEEAQTGTMAQSAAKVPGRAAFKEPQYTTSSAPTRETLRQPIYGTPGMEGPVERGVSPTADEGQMGADIRSATTPGAKADVTTAGVAQTKDPHEAVQRLRNLDKQIESPDFSQRPEAEQNTIKARRENLSQQLKMYYDSPYTRRFGAENVPNILSNVHDFADAQAQLEHVAEPVFQRMDAASASEQYPGGEFSHWRDRIKAAQRIIQTSSSPEAVDTAMQREAEGNAKILDLIDRHRDQVGMDDYIAAKNTWRQASRLGELHARIERMMNGITPEEVTEFGKTRMMKAGSTEALDEYLRDDTNRKQIEELIGRDGVSNLKDITDLFHSAPNNRAAREVGNNVVDYMWHRGLLTKLGYLTGGLGLGAVMGREAVAASAAALGVEGTRFFLRYAATNPTVGNMLRTVVGKGIPPKIYMPLISRVIAEQSGLMQPPKEEEPAEQEK